MLDKHFHPKIKLCTSSVCINTGLFCIHIHPFLLDYVSMNVSIMERVELQLKSGIKPQLASSSMVLELVLKKLGTRSVELWERLSTTFYMPVKVFSHHTSVRQQCCCNLCNIMPWI